MNSIDTMESKPIGNSDEHLRGGIAYDCKGLDIQLVNIKEKYNNNPKIIAKIAEYDQLFYTVHWLQVNGLIQ